MNLEVMTKKLAAKLGFRIVRDRAADEQVTLTSTGFRGLLESYESLLGRDGVELPANGFRHALLGRLLGTSIPEAYALIEALARTAGVPGDVCEFGVAQGATSALIANEIQGGEKVLHLFDSFEGLPAPTAGDSLKDDPEGLGSIGAYAGRWAYPPDMVTARLAELGFPQERIRIHKGFVEDIVRNSHDLPPSVSCAYLDFDFYEPIKVTLDFLDGVLSPGAVVVVDDYDFFSTGVKQATDGFVASHSGYDLRVAEQPFGHFAVLRREGR